MSERVAVLLVDDRSENLLALDAVLDKAGLDLVKATSGDEALRLTLKHDFALVLLDVQMPGMSGFEVAELMRANPKTRHLPIIFVTAGIKDARLQFKGYELGAVDYLIKPFEPHVLQSKVRVFCELYRHRRKFERAHKESLVNAMREGYANCRMVYENGQAVDFVYIEVNTAFEKLTGMKDLAGKRFSSLIPGFRESNPELFEVCVRVAETGNPEILETHLERANRWVSISIYSTERGYFVAVFQDITERKRFEQEMIVMNNQLSHEVAMRTADLSALTAHIHKIAETEKSNLARELHDELGSTLVALKLEVERLGGEAPTPELAEGFSRIKGIVVHALQTTRNVVNQLYPTVLDDCGLVAAIQWQAKEFRTHTGIAIEVSVPKESVIAERTYALAAYRITQECLTNIAKHAGADKIQIEVAGNNGFLDLTIRDNGKGMPDKIKTGGHGIFGMVERARYLGGSMEIGSEPGKGTTARLHLPMAAPKPKNKRRVLVVDDHAIVRDAIRRLLDTEADDFAVAGEAADGKAGVQAATSEDWDIVLMDISMPKKNGLQALEEIVAVKPGLPIIMLSSHAQHEYAEVALSKGAAAYVEKGEADKLVEAMRRAVLLKQAALEKSLVLARMRA
jgi:PAS domain S-box-containing protein